MKIVQIRSDINYGDGIGNTIINLDKVLSKKYDSLIAVRKCSREFEGLPNLVKFDNVTELCVSKDDILIIHFGGADELIDELFDIEGKRIVMYQNVTYPYFYVGIDDSTMSYCAEGQRFIRNTKDCFLKAIAPSSFSKNELVHMGWKEEDVYLLPLPVVLNQKTIVETTNTERRRFLSVGRIVPNKKIEDVLTVFDYYRKNYYLDSYLDLVGMNYQDAYYSALVKYMEENDIKNVIFHNHVSDDELKKLYEESEVYICMSEHEGFCMPIIEAMNNGLPVLAYNATAVPDTMGEAGILLNTKDPSFVCEQINKLFENNVYKKQIIKKQKQHVDSYVVNNYEKKLFRIVDEVINTKEYSYDKSRYGFYKILLNEIEDNAGKDLFKQYLRLKRCNRKVVVYGIGKAGKSFLNLLDKRGLKVDAICDANKCGEVVFGIKVFSLEECIKLYSEAVFVVTIQDEQTVLDITDRLNQLGIDQRDILFFSNKKKLLCV